MGGRGWLPPWQKLCPPLAPQMKLHFVQRSMESSHFESDPVSPLSPLSPPCCPVILKSLATPLKFPKHSGKLSKFLLSFSHTTDLWYWRRGPNLNWKNWNGLHSPWRRTSGRPTHIIGIIIGLYGDILRNRKRVSSLREILRHGSHFCPKNP